MARKPKSAGKPIETQPARTLSRRKRASAGNPFDEVIEVRTNSETRYIPAQKATHVREIELEPKTEPQRQMIEAYANGLNVFATGSAGTGKTYVALALGLQDLMLGRIRRIIIVRSAVQTRDQGFLPGTEAEKMSVYSLPYQCMVNEIAGNAAMWEILTKKNMIVFMSTSFIRGVTLDDSLVILDEAQNLDLDEGDSVVTRLGQGSRLIVCGDTKQNDLKRNRETSGLAAMLSIAESIPKFFDSVVFLPQDIVRSPLVKAWIIAKESMV